MKTHRVFTLALIVTQVLMMLSYSTVRAEDWQMFRHDPEHLGFTTSTGPIKTPVVLWRFQASSDIASSPAVVNGRVFITDYTGDLYCLNASTGDQVWASRATDSPAVLGDIVYAGHNVITAFNGSSGEKIWSDQSLYGDGGISPAVTNGAVFTAFDGCYAYNASTGVRLWNFTTGDVISPPAVSEGIVYFGFGYGVLALNSSTGDRIWQFTPDYLGLPLYEQSSPSISGNRVYVGLADGLYCLDAKTGSQIWNNSLGASATSPAIGNGIVYFGSAYGPNVYAFNASTGTRIWNYTTGYRARAREIFSCCY
jgi:outer membrane protein assembly factor BamB